MKTFASKPRRTRTSHLLVYLLAGVLLAACGTLPSPNVVESVTIDGGDFDLQVGTSTTLTATVAPAGAPQGVTWSSSDDAVVTVDAGTGLVTATGTAGQTATITATSDADDTIADTVTVTLQSADAPVITDFSSTILRESQVDLTWSATLADEYDVLALADDGSTVLLETGLTVTSVTLPIPASDQQTLRLVARNADGNDTDFLTLSNVVTSTADYDPYSGLGYTPEPSIPGTLRDVIANAPSGSVVGFASDITSLVVDGVDLENVPDLVAEADAHFIFRDDVTVSGPPIGVTIEGGSNCPDCTTAAEDFVWRSRLMLVLPGVSVTLENLTLTGGAFIYSGAGVQNYGTLTLDTVAVTGNRSFGRGGGIHNKGSGDLTIVDSSVVNNRSVTLEDEIDATFYIRNDPAGEVDFPGANGSGGGIYNDLTGVVSILNSVIDTNEARVSGGGIYNLGTLDVVGTNVNGNDADHNVYDATEVSYFSYGGGIYNDGTFTFDGGDIDGNVAASQGGGLYHDVNGFSTLTSVLIQGNLAGTLGETGYGGGVMHNHYTGEEARLSLPPSPYGPGNDPQDILVNDRGPRPSELRLAPSSTLPSGGDPDDRN